MVSVSAGERISYEHLITSLPAGTMVDLLLQRKGKEVHAQVTTSPAQFLIPRTVSLPPQTRPDQPGLSPLIPLVS